MKKSIKVAPKRRGRPVTGGRDPHIAARMPQALIDEVEAWAAANDASRSEAFRRLVELGLKAHVPESKAVGRLRKRVAGAANLAVKGIDSLTVDAADADKKASRKRRLTKGLSKAKAK